MQIRLKLSFLSSTTKCECNETRFETVKQRESLTYNCVVIYDHPFTCWLHNGKDCLLNEITSLFWIFKLRIHCVCKIKIFNFFNAWLYRRFVVSRKTSHHLLECFALHEHFVYYVLPHGQLTLYMSERSSTPHLLRSFMNWLT